MSFKIYLDDPERVADFVAKHIPRLNGLPISTPNTAIGVTRDGELIGGFVYHNWSETAQVIEISAASTDRQWWNRDILFHLHAYPFDGLKCQMLVTQFSARDTHIQRAHAAYGYKLHHIPRLLGRDHDGVISRLTFEDWITNPFTRSYLKREALDGHPYRQEPP